MKAATQTRIVLADDNEIFRDGFKVMIKKQPDILLVGEAADGQELIDLVHKGKPDVVVTDIKMPGVDGLQATRHIAKLFPQIGIIALSMYDEDNLIVEMLEAGARGYLLKNAHKNEIIEAIKAVNNNENYYCNDTSTKLAQMIAKSRFRNADKTERIDFTERELAVIRCICQEMSNKQIASELKLSIRTIEGYRDRIQEKIGAKNGAGIVVYAIRNGIYKVE